MDFEGNLQRVLASIREAKARGARYRVGPELELTGYGCEDHFLETDTVDHAWEMVAELIQSGATQDIVADVGMPVIHNGVRYNCRLFLLGSRLLLLRPKMHLADDGNYREGRYFTSWKKVGEVEEHWLPSQVANLCGQKTVPFGDAALQFSDAVLAAETCEELFTPLAPNIRLALSGVEIITNGSGSHHQLRKLDVRLDLIRNATAKAGGVYLYANQRGCDGSRLYYDGSACAVLNGVLLEQASQFSLKDVEVVVATVDVDAVRSFRASVPSLQHQASTCTPVPRVEVDFALCAEAAAAIPLPLSQPTEPIRHCPEQEIALGPAAWLWDYLRRSGASGFLLPLSGGADSASTAAIVGSMCQMLAATIADGNEQAKADVRRLARLDADVDVTALQPRDLAGRFFTTMYMGSENSSAETTARARQLAEEIGAYHLSIRIDAVVAALVSLFASVTGHTPRFLAHGGSRPENLALQNIQARVRMVVAFLFAQLLPWVTGRPAGGGFLLVLGSANVDELLRGYLTKYDCSSADINPIGGISKQDLRSFLRWAAKELGYPSLATVEEAPPTAELEPLAAGKILQNDEEDMGISYSHLSMLGRLRKISRCGPVSMFRALLQAWSGVMSVMQVAERVKFFFRYYSINRHKATTITPAYHAEQYSPDDNRFDHRQFLYNTTWAWQFKQIDECVAAHPDAGGQEGVSS